MLHIALIVAAAWVALSLLGVASVTLLNRAGRRSDRAAYRDHQEFLARCGHASSVGEPLAPTGTARS